MSQEQLREAHELIEKGRIAEARQLLQTIDDPTAKQWLAQLNAAKRSQKQSLSPSLPLLIAVAIVIGVGALIVILLLTPTLINRLQNQPTPLDPTAAYQQVSGALLNYCTQAVNNVSNCAGWIQAVMGNHRDAVSTCVSQSTASAALHDCLANNGVPLPS